MICRIIALRFTISQKNILNLLKNTNIYKRKIKKDITVG
jgi:hypothetical protein